MKLARREGLLIYLDYLEHKGRYLYMFWTALNGEDGILSTPEHLVRRGGGGRPLMRPNTGRARGPAPTRQARATPRTRRARPGT
jgi:hypothetical protein